MKKQPQTKHFVSYFFRPRTLQKSSSRVGGVTISENDLKKSSFFRCHFWYHFLLKNQVFSTYPNTSNHEKTLFFAMKTKNLHVLSKNRGQKNDQKNTSNRVNKWVRKPQKWGSCRGEMVGCEKSVFLQK